MELYSQLILSTSSRVPLYPDLGLARQELIVYNII